MECLFKETQRCNFKLLWIIILVISGVMIYSFSAQVFFGVAIGSNPAPDFFVLFIAPVIGFGLPLFFYNLKLTTDVTPAGIRVKYFPLTTANFKMSDVETAEMRTYNPLNEFGGWGVREGYKIKCYTMSGKEGVEIRMKSGKRILIGTRRKQQLYEAIRIGINPKFQITSTI